MADSFFRAEIVPHDLKRGHPSSSHVGKQTLGHYPFQGIGKAVSDLLFLFDIEHAKDTVDGLACV